MDRNIGGRKKRSDAIGSRHRRWLYSFALLVTLGLMFGPALQAVHSSIFEIEDGNIASVTGTVDWDQIFDSAGANQSTLPANFTAAKFTKDFNTTTKNGATVFATNDATTFTSGSKDTLPISTGWSCTASSNVNSKVDIMNAYATAYTDPGTGQQFLYFALERNTNTGDANVAFWFLQDQVSCDSAGGTALFKGNHQDGDLLVVSAFTNGGAVSAIDVYRWNIPDPTNDPIGSLGTTAIAEGGDCRDPLLITNDKACATSNTGTLSNIPWLTSNFKDGLGHQLLTSEFFEGGVNLTLTNLAGKCFNVFTGDTRSSQSLTSTIFDYALGDLGECSSKTETQQSVSGGTTGIPVDPADSDISVTDSATVTVTGVSTWEGSVTFHLCGPSDANGTGFTCGTGGVAVGSAKTVSNSSKTVTSAAAIVTAAGRYCWRADFHATTPASGIPDSTDARASTECFKVTPAQPSLSTDATDGPVAFGGKISDSVTLVGTAHKPGTGGPTGSDLNGSINPTTKGLDATGNITVVAYGPNSCTTVAFTSNAIAASGDGTYGGATTAFEFTPSAPGLYVFVASYAGDSPNTFGINAGACASAPDSEKVTVQQIPTAIKTKQSWIPNDTATITADTGDLGANGTVVFSLFMGGTCDGTAVYTETKTGIGGTGKHSQEVSTTNGSNANTTFVIATGYTDTDPSTTGVYSWLVTYTPAAGDTAHTGRKSSCSAEHFNTTYTNDPGPGSVP